MENIEAMLCAFIEGDLDEAGRAEIEKHLQEHPEHRKLLTELMATRDLVRDLPRVRAPFDVSESLHGQVERSILLDGDTGSSSLARRGRLRWTTVLAIAAVFLLSTALCFFVYRALVPTMQEPAFTEIASSSQPPTDDASVANQRKMLLNEDLATAKPDAVAAAPAPEKQVANSGTVRDSKDVEGNKEAVAMNMLGSANAPAVPQQQMNYDAMRNSLNSNYQNVVAANVPGRQPLLLVINTPNTPQTNSTVIHFLTAAGGSVSWSKLPATQSPATQPGGQMPAEQQAQAMAKSQGSRGNLIAGKSATEPSVPAALPSAGPMLGQLADEQKNIPTTQPSSQLYVVKGMTRQQADVLRQSFVGDDKAQIFEPASSPVPNQMQSQLDQVERTKASPAPTTQPSASDVATATAATQPSEAGAAGGQAQIAAQSAVVDAVIVVQEIAPTQQQQQSIGGESQVPSTQPDAHADSATTMPSPR